MGRIGIIHLSDLHLSWSDPRESVFESAEILPQIESNCGLPEKLLVVVTGDLVDKGEAEAFELARGFLIDLRARIISRIGDQHFLGFAMVPGNHDIVDPRERAVLSAGRRIKEEHRKAGSIDLKNEELEHVLAYQDEFWKLASELAGGRKTSVSSRISDSWSWEFENFKIIALSLNTALLCDSSTDDDQGKLLAVLPGKLPTANLRIAIMHHPFNWLKRDNANEIEQKLRSWAHIVYCGHEHFSDTYLKQWEDSEGYLMLRASDFRSPNTENAFSYLEVNLESAIYQHSTFKRKSGSFHLGQQASWRPIDLSLTSGHRTLRLTQSFREHLEDPGNLRGITPLDKVQIQDIFVWPKVAEISMRGKPAKIDARDGGSKQANQQSPRDGKGEASEKVLSSENLLCDPAKPVQMYVLGDPRSGKTALLKSVYLRQERQGKVPLLLDLNLISNLTEDRFRELLRESVHRQYGADSSDLFFETPIGQRLALVDDADRCRILKDDGHSDLMRLIRKYFGNWVVAADEVFGWRRMFAELSNKDAGGIAAYRLLPFDSHQRSQICTALLGCLHGNDDEVFESQYSELVRIVDGVIGERLVTPSPFQVKSIVLDFLTGNVHASQYGAYGFIYERMVKQDIAVAIQGDKSVEQTLSDVLLPFLANLASRQRDDLPGDVTHAQFDESIEWVRGQKIKMSAEKIREVLIKSRILEFDESRVRFRERYQSYFFLAYEIHEQLKSERRRETGMKRLSTYLASLHEQSSAEVILFVLHLGRDEEVIQLIADRAAQIFRERPSFEFETHVNAPYVSGGESEIVEDVDDWDDHHQKSDLEPPEDGFVDRSDESLPSSESDYLFTGMNEAFNLQNILGQALRNYPMAIELEFRERLLRECYSISLRAYSAFGDLVDSKSVEFEMLARRHLNVKVGADILEAVQFLKSRLMGICGYGIARRAAYSVGSPHLETLLVDTLPFEATSAGKMLHVAVLMELRRYRPEDVRAFFLELKDQPVGRVVLVNLVANSLRTYRYEDGLKKQFCAAVNIDPSTPAFQYSRRKPRSIGRR